MASHHFEVVQKSHATEVSQIFEAINPSGGRYLVEVLSTPGVGPWLDAYKSDMAAVAMLRHPCILEVLDLGAMPDGTPVIVSERPEGTTLGRWLARGHVAPTDAAMDLLTSVAHALGCAHDAGVSHGALTADDVLLLEISQHAVGFPKLRGFGYRWLRAAAAFGQAPTMVPGQRVVPASRREVTADIAALATLADRLLTPLRNSPQVSSVVRSAQLGEEGRFATPAAFIEALEAALDPHREPEERTEPNVHVPWSVRHRGLRRVLATAVATVVVAGSVHALLASRKAHSIAEVAPRPVVVSRPPPPSRPPSLAGVVVGPPAPPTAEKVPVAREVKPTAPQPRLHRVWSAKENRLIYVDDQGAVVEPPPGSGAN
jgi:serine/threonine protein kinase